MADKNKGFIPGVIVFSALIIFFGGILWLSGKSIFFSGNYRVYMEFADVSGLRNQMPVAMRGVQVGWIRDVTFGKEAVKVAADIKRKFSIPVDSQVEITSLNLIGEKAITITPGQSPVAVQPGATLQGTNKDIMIVASSILAQAKTKIEDVHFENIIRKATDSIDSLLTLVRNMNTRVEKLDMDLYNRRVDDIGLASQELRRFVNSLSGETKKVGQETGESLEKFNQTLEGVDQALQRLADLSSEIKSVAQKIDRTDIFNNLSQTLQELNAFLADIKKNPKKYVKFSIF